jgi:cytoskeletal protein RodZ
MATATWRRTRGKPMQRSLALIAGAGLATALALAWLPAENYRPIMEGERGTLFDGVAAIRDLPSGRAPLASERRAAATASPVGNETGESVPTASTTTTSSSTTSSTTSTTVARAVRNTTTSSSSTTTSTTTETSTTSTTAP